MCLYCLVVKLHLEGFATNEANQSRRYAFTKRFSKKCYYYFIMQKPIKFHLDIRTAQGTLLPVSGSSSSVRPQSPASSSPSSQGGKIGPAITFCSVQCADQSEWCKPGKRRLVLSAARCKNQSHPQDSQRQVARLAEARDKGQLRGFTMLFYFLFFQLLRFKNMLIFLIGRQRKLFITVSLMKITLQGPFN